MSTLTKLPFDVIQLISSFLLPYDVLSLSRTCHSFKTLKNERAIWLQVAESVSRSRPMPFTAAQALDLPLEVVIGACLRAERIAKGWAAPNVYSRKQPVKISFTDHRIITFFTFLPGSRHLMVLDALNVLSCWTTEGTFLAAWRVQLGAKLSRWKPCDESENTYDLRDGRVQAVEIMIEFPVSEQLISIYSRPTSCSLLLLTYSECHASFESVSEFQIPRVFEPFSAMTQDELRGSLVRLNTEPGRVGIFLTDKNTEKSVCIDTGLTLVLECVPQALLSASHLVLYWEMSSSAHAFTYELGALRKVLSREGRPHNDPLLGSPVHFPPSDVCTIPFRTVNVPNESINSPYPTCYGCGRGVEQTYLPSTDLSRNRDAYPIIIPKWHTLREDLGRHRTRSVLTFSQRPSVTVQAQAQALALYVNAPDFDTLHIHLINEDGHVEPHDANDAAPDPLEGGQAPQAMYHFDGHSFSRSLAPRTTITHHYFDCIGSSSSSNPKEIVRTVLADAPLRRPQSLRIHQHHTQAMVTNDLEVEDVNMTGAGIHHAGGYDDEIDDEAPEDGNGGFDNVGAVNFNHGLFDVFNWVDENGEEHNAWHHNGAPPNEGGAIQHEDIAALQTGMEGLGLNLDGDNHNHVGRAPDTGAAPPLPQVHVHHEGSIWNLTAEAAHALADILQDPFGGSPVMGYGGRCAMWVEEHPKKYRAGGREPVLRIATFPTYEPPDEDQDGTFHLRHVHPELEVSCGRVATFHLPGYIALESSYTFDLDDVRGLVGIATLLGELWIVDFS